MLIEYRLKLVILLIKHFVDYQYSKEIAREEGRESKDQHPKGMIRNEPGGSGGGNDLRQPGRINTRRG
jgi:hypothetical protein